MYMLLKSVHVTAVVASGVLFQIRALWMAAGSARLHDRWVRVLPHVIDTVLLASAVALAVRLRLNPLEHGWLAAKLALLGVYVVLGSIALRRGRTRRLRLAAWAGATLAFGYIVAVALGKSAWPMG